MKARTTILAATAALALSGLAPQVAGGSIPADSHSGYVKSVTSTPRALQSGTVRSMLRDIEMQRVLAVIRTFYRESAYVPGGSSPEVAKAIQAAGKKAPSRGLQSGKTTAPIFHYAR